MRVVHVMPSGDVITLFVVAEPATAQNNPVEFAVGDQHTPYQIKSAAETLLVQVKPSGEVITLFPVPPLATAQNKFNSGDQQTS